MILSVNDTPLKVQAPYHIVAVLEHLQINQASGLAIAVNSQVVPKTEWESHALKENDEITIIRPTQGG